MKKNQNTISHNFKKFDHITLEEFTKYFPNSSSGLLHITTEDEDMYSGYKVGLNERPMGWSDSGFFAIKGISFTTISDMPKNSNAKHIFCREISFLPNTVIRYLFDDRFQADRVIMGELKKIEDLELWKDKEFCLKSLRTCGMVIRFIKESDYTSEDFEEFRIEAVKNNSSAIEYIKNPSKAVQMAAVQENPYAIYDIYNPSEDVRMEAVKLNGLAIQYIRGDANSPIVEETAIRQNPESIRYVRDPNREMQLFAVSEMKSLIKYIYKPHPDVLAIVDKIVE